MNKPGSRKKQTVRAFRQFAKKKIGKQLLIAEAVLVALVGTTYIVNAQQYRNKFIEGTHINGYNVGEMTVDQVEAMLKPVVEEYQLKLVLRDGKEEVIDGSAIDFSYTPGDEIATVLNEQNSYSWIRGAFGAKEEYTVKTPVSYSEEKLLSLLNSFPEMQTEQMTAPVNASMVLDENNAFQIVPETMGNQINQEAMTKTVKESLSELKSEADLTKAEGVYENPSILADNEALLQAVEDGNQFLSTTITYTDHEGKELKKIDRSVTKDWFVQDEETGLLHVDQDNVSNQAAQYVAAWAAEDDNYGQFRTFRSTNYGTIKISTSELHGHTLNQSQIVTEIVTDVMGHADDVKHEIPYSEFQDAKDPQMGGTYVEVDVDAQEVYVYQNYECVYSTSTVTGAEYSTPTPSGIYSIYYRDRNAQLTGAMREDGTPSYVSEVSYWMAFYEGYGLHDATWRGSFGGSIYQYNGSHGCVNLPYKAAKQIWSLTDYGTPVIVFRASNQ